MRQLYLSLSISILFFFSLALSLWTMAEQALSAGAAAHTYLAVLKDTAALHIIDSVRCKVCYTFSIPLLVVPA